MISIGSAFSRPISGKDMAAWDAKHPKPKPTTKERPVVTKTKDGKRTVRAVRPNAGLAAAYQRKIDALIDEMGNSIRYWVKASYRQNEPEVAKLAQDSPADELRDAIRQLRRRWERRFDRAAQELADHFAKGVTQRSDSELRKILRKAGISVEFRTTAAVRDVLKAIVSENVSLIKSIPEAYMTSVEGSVMRSVVAGRDLGGLATELQYHFGVTKRRASLITLQQNNSATSAIQKVRFTELGIERGVWRHSHAGKTPRPTHLANDNEEYDIRTGWFDPDPKVRKYIRPGELIHCFPGSTPVGLDGGVIERLWRSPFDGEVVNLVVGADLLQPTPNHPILTRYGWRAADAVETGDDVVCVLLHDADVVAGQEDEPVPSFDDLFEACSIAFGGEVRREGLGFDFHGDIPHGDVDEILVDLHLLSELDAAFRQNFGKFHLPKTDRWIHQSIGNIVDHVLEPSLTRALGVLLPLFKRVPVGDDSVRLGLRPQFATGFPDDRFNQGARELELVADGWHPVSSRVGLDDPYFGGMRNVDEPVSRNGVSTPFRGTPGHGKATRSELLADHVRRESDRGCRIFQFGSSRYELRRVVEKSIGYHSGHVYTLQSSRGYFIAGASKILAQNCRCFVTPILPGF